jgi:hypothetical protein
VEEGEKQ